MSNITAQKILKRSLSSSESSHSTPKKQKSNKKPKNAQLSYNFLYPSLSKFEQFITTQFTKLRPVVLKSDVDKIKIDHESSKKIQGQEQGQEQKKPSFYLQLTIEGFLKQFFALYNNCRDIIKTILMIINRLQPFLGGLPSNIKFYLIHSVFVEDNYHSVNMSLAEAYFFFGPILNQLPYNSELHQVYCAYCGGNNIPHIVKDFDKHCVDDWFGEPRIDLNSDDKQKIKKGQCCIIKDAYKYMNNDDEDGICNFTYCTFFDDCGNYYHNNRDDCGGNGAPCDSIVCNWDCHDKYCDNEECYKKYPEMEQIQKSLYGGITRLQKKKLEFE